MNKDDLIRKKVEFAEKRIAELDKEGNLKKLSDTEKYHINKFYQDKSINRIKTAKLIYNASKKSESYTDYAEAVAAAYYAMYYIVHGFLALNYKIQIREGLRGVHSITEHIILYYLVKTNKLAKHLYEEYLKSYEATAEIQKLSVEDFKEEAYKYAKKYSVSRDSREKFTYITSSKVEEYHAKQAIDSADEFISTIRELMTK
jgi:uncharacterized protein (UPF0332 family)